MFENSIILLDWLGIVVFTITGALVASRNQMDVVGFILLGTVTGIGGGTIRDLVLDAHPVLWVERPQYLGVCILVSIAVRSDEHTSELQSLMRISYTVFCLTKNNYST